MSNSTDFNDGAAYEQLMGRWSRLVGRRFLDWCACPPDLDWLDIGCGNGAFTEEIIARAQPRTVAGIDPSPGQIAFAQQRGGTAMATFAVGDAEHPPFAAQSFDVVTMGLVIAFVAQPATAVAQMARMTRPGGFVHTYMWQMGRSPIAPLQQALRDLGMPGGAPASAAVATEDGLRDLWQDAGLREVMTTRLDLDVRFGTFEEFLASMTLPLGPQADRLRTLTAEQRAGLEAWLRAAFPVHDDGSVTYSATASAVCGLK